MSSDGHRTFGGRSLRRRFSLRVAPNGTSVILRPTYLPDLLGHSRELRGAIRVSHGLAARLAGISASGVTGTSKRPLSSPVLPSEYTALGSTQPVETPVFPMPP